MITSNCCGAIFYEPGYPENDICSCCNEHADAIDQDKPYCQEKENENTSNQS